MQDAMHSQMFVELIEPRTKETTNKSHSNKDKNVLNVPQVALLRCFTALHIIKTHQNIIDILYKEKTYKQWTLEEHDGFNTPTDQLMKIKYNISNV